MQSWGFEATVGDEAVANESLQVRDGLEPEGDFQQAVVAEEIRRRGNGGTSGEPRANQIGGIWALGTYRTGRHGG